MIRRLEGNGWESLSIVACEVCMSGGSEVGIDCDCEQNDMSDWRIGIMLVEGSGTLWGIKVRSGDIAQ